MTTLTNLNINGVDCKVAVLSFDITKTIDGLPNIFSGKFARLALDALNVPALRHALAVYYTCADATAEYEFNGYITKVDPVGGFYEIEAQSLSKKLLEQTFSTSQFATMCDNIVMEISELDTGMTFSHPSGGWCGNYVAEFYGYNERKYDLLRWLCLLSQNGANAPWIFYQSGRDNVTFVWDKFGRYDTGITLAVGTHATEPMTWKKDENQIINTVTVNYTTGTYVATDAGSISTYGTRNTIINRPDINAAADATLIANQIVFYFKAPLEVVTAKVTHDSLFSGTHYDVLNQKYTLTDATVDKTSQGPYACIKHILHYPSFVDELTFGIPYASTQSLLNDILSAMKWLSKDTFCPRVSDTVQHSLDAVASTASTTYVKLKTITFSAGLPARFRVKFDLKTSNGSYLAYGEIYWNGVNIGTEHSTTSTTYVTYSVDCAFFMQPADTLEIWAHIQAGGGATAYVQNFRVCYDMGLVKAPISDGDTITTSYGNVTGPAGATDNATPRFNGVSGTLLQDSAVTIADTTGAISIAGHLAITDPTASPAGKVLQDDGAWHTLAGGGNVTGPGTSTDNAIARYNGTGGTSIQDSAVTIDDTTGKIYIAGHAAMTDPTASPTGKFLRDDGTWQTVSGSFDPANATTITPVTDDTYDLGASTPKTWRTLYLGSANQVRSASLVAFRNVAGSADQSISVKTCQMSYAASLLAGAYLMGVQNSDYVLIEGGTTVTNGGIVLGSGGDTNLYRSAANQLKTDDSFDAYDYDIGGTAIITNAKVLANVTCDTGIVTSGQFSISRMPRGTAGYVIRGTGAGSDPAYALLAFTDMATGRITLTQMTVGTSGYFLKGQGASDPVYAAIVGADLPAPAASVRGGVALPATPTGTFYKDDGTWGTVAGSGDVVGPASATDHAIARYNTTTGKLIQDSLASVDDAGLLNAVSLNIGGTVVLNSSRVLQNVSGSIAQFTSGKLPITQLENGAEAAFIRGFGGGVDPAWSNIAYADIPVNANPRLEGIAGFNAAGEVAYTNYGSATVYGGVGAKYGTGTIIGVYKSAGGGSFGAATLDALTLAETTGNATLVGKLTISVGGTPLALTGATDAKILITESTNGLQIRNAGDSAWAPLNCGALGANAVTPHTGNTYELGAASLGWSGLRLGAASANILVNDVNAKRSLILTAAGGWPSTTSGCGAPAKTEYATNKQNLYRMSFVAGSASYAEWTVAMPANWDGSTVTAVFYWMQPGTTNQNIVWGIAGRSYGDGELVDQAWGSSVTVTDDSSATANQVRISDATGACTIGGTPASGELVQLRIFRYGTGSDTLTQTAQLIAVKIQYGINAYSDA